SVPRVSGGAADRRRAPAAEVGARCRSHILAGLDGGGGQQQVHMAAPGARGHIDGAPRRRHHGRGARARPSQEPGIAMSAPRASLDIVIADWTAGPILLDCLASLRSGLEEVATACNTPSPAVRTAGPRLERVVVVDNGSLTGCPVSAGHLGLPLEVIGNER